MFAPNEVTVTQPKLLELWFSGVFVILSIHVFFFVNNNLVHGRFFFAKIVYFFIHRNRNEQKRIKELVTHPRFLHPFLNMRKDLLIGGTKEGLAAEVA